MTIVLCNGLRFSYLVRIFKLVQTKDTDSSIWYTIRQYSKVYSEVPGPTSSLNDTLFYNVLRYFS